MPPAKLKTREETVVAMAALLPNDQLQLQSGKRHFTLKPADLEHYFGERGKRGLKLPRGFQRVDGIQVVKGK